MGRGHCIEPRGPLCSWQNLATGRGLSCHEAVQQAASCKPELLAGSTPKRGSTPRGCQTGTYQLDIIRTCLLCNTLVCLPTGLGKTLIAAVVMHNFTRWFPEVAVPDSFFLLVLPQAVCPGGLPRSGA